MKHKLYNLLLIVFSLFGYLEWGKGNYTFLFSVELEIFKNLFTDFSSVAHPFTLIPLAGQLVLLVTLFQQTPGKWLTFLGLGCIAVLFLFYPVCGNYQC